MEIWMGMFRKHWQKIFFWHPFIAASHWMQREEAAACIRLTGPRADGWEWKIQLLLYSELCPLSRQGNVHKVGCSPLPCWRSQIPPIFIVWHLNEKKHHNESTHLMKMFSWSPDSWTLCWKWHPDSAILDPAEAGVCQLPVTAAGTGRIPANPIFCIKLQLCSCTLCVSVCSMSK